MAFDRHLRLEQKKKKKKEKKKKKTKKKKERRRRSEMKKQEKLYGKQCSRFSGMGYGKREAASYCIFQGCKGRWR